MAGILNRDSGGPEHLYEESERGREFKLRPRALVGREGKGKGFETETQEVLSAIGSAYCSLKTLGSNTNKIGSAYYSLQRLGKHHKPNKECLLLTETRQAPLTKC